MAQFARYFRPNPRSHNLSLTLAQAGIVVTFALAFVWDRFSTQFPPPLLLPRLYLAYFVLLVPMLVTIAAWLLGGLPGFAQLRKHKLRAFWTLLILTLALWGYLSTSWQFIRDVDPNTGLNAAIQLLVAMLFVAAVACAGPPARVIVAALVLGLVFNSAITILQSALQHSLGLQGIGEYVFGPNQPGVGIIRSGAWTYVRPMGLMPHSNMLAGSLLAGIFAACALLLSPRPRIRWLGTGLFALGLWALLLTFSRGAWIGLAAGLFAVAPLLFRRLRDPQLRTHVAIVAGVALALGAIFVASYRPLIAARGGEGQESIELRSVSDRLVFTDFALRSIAERPILGVGIGNFPWRASYLLVGTGFDLRGDNVHHVPLSAWAELGVVGFALVVLALMVGVEAALRAIKGSTDAADHTIPDGAARIALLAIVFAYVVVGLLDHYPWTTLHFQVLWWGSLAVASKDNC